MNLAVLTMLALTTTDPYYVPFDSPFCVVDHDPIALAPSQSDAKPADLALASEGRGLKYEGTSDYFVRAINAENEALRIRLREAPLNHLGDRGLESSCISIPETTPSFELPATPLVRDVRGTFVATRRFSQQYRALEDLKTIAPTYLEHNGTTAVQVIKEAGWQKHQLYRRKDGIFELVAYRMRPEVNGLKRVEEFMTVRMSAR